MPYRGVGVAEKWIRFTDRIMYVTHEDSGLIVVACPTCAADMGLVLVGEPGENPDAICPMGHRFVYPNAWPMWWEENSRQPTFEPHRDEGGEPPAG